MANDDNRRTRVGTVAAGIRQEFSAARMEQDGATARRDALEGTDTQLAREHDSSVAWSEAVRGVCESLSASDAYV